MNAEILSDATNCAVVAIPGRKFPAVAIQGDSLKVLVELAEEIDQLSRQRQSEDLSAAVSTLREKLQFYLAAYETTMKARGLELPWSNLQ